MLAGFDRNDCFGSGQFTLQDSPVARVRRMGHTADAADCHRATQDVACEPPAAGALHLIDHGIDRGMRRPAILFCRFLRRFSDISLRYPEVNIMHAPSRLAVAAAVTLATIAVCFFGIRAELSQARQSAPAREALALTRDYQ
jgi:hypothetical protein